MTLTDGPRELGAPRPVTPVGILAALLDDLTGELAGSIPAASEAKLRRAGALAAGLDPYIAACTTPESPELRALATRTAEEDWTRHHDAGVGLEQEMLSGHVEGQTLKMLVHMTRATRVLEVGMFTGYSALAMAEALPEDGRVVACEIDPGVAAIAQSAFDASPHGSKITVMVGPAAATLEQLSEERAAFDLVFIDADKAGYLHYLHCVLDGGLLAAHGVVCVDNTLMQGQPYVDPGVAGEPTPANGQAIAAFNRAVADDPRVEQVLIPLRDGVTLIRRVDAG